MSAITKYTRPSFVSGQKLTADDLNNIVGLIEPQSHQTRRGLIGVGIACGLELEGKEGAVNLSSGAAVSSDGCLFYVKNGADYVYGAKSQLTLHANGQSVAIEAWEMQPVDSGTGSKDAPANDPYFILAKQKENKKTNTNACGDLEPNGSNETVSICLYAVEKKSLGSLWLCTDEGGIQSSEPIFPLVKRIDLKKQESNLWALYYASCEEALAEGSELTKAILQVLGGEQGLIALNALNEFLQNLVKEYPFQLQYFWAYLKDLVAAYEEWAMACVELAEVAAGCQPDDKFADFVVLGNLKGACRMPWYPVQSPTSQCDLEKLEKRHFLHERLKCMLLPENLLFGEKLPNYPSPNDEQMELRVIRVTGSQPKHLPLGQLAVPYYYRADDSKFLKKWSYELTKCQRWAHIPSFHNDFQGLHFDLERYPFFRVEGHIWWPVQAAFNAIVNRRDMLNLPFKVLIVKSLEEQGNCAEQIPQQLSYTHPLSLSSFCAVRPGLEHMCGVPQGGTLVLVADRDCRVMADFCLPYAHEERPAAMFHVVQIERGRQDNTVIIANDSLMAEHYDWEVWRIDGPTLVPLPYSVTQTGIAITTNVKAVLQIRIRLTAWLDMWEDHFTQDIDLRPVEQVKLLPTALFHEQQRIYGVDGQGVAKVTLHLNNDSVNAERYEWRVDRADASVILDEVDKGVELTLPLPLENQNNQVTVTLSAFGENGDSDSYVQTIDLCPKEMRLVLQISKQGENTADLEGVEEVIIPPTQLGHDMELGIVYSPLGCELSMLPDNRFFTLTQDKQTGTGSIAWQANDFPVITQDSILTIISKYPCSNYERQARIIFQAPPPSLVLDVVNRLEDREAASGTTKITETPGVGRQPAPATSLNARRNGYRLNVEAQATADKRLASTKSYKSTHHFVTTPPLNFADWHKPFAELAKLLLASAAKPSGVDDERYLALLQNATWRYLDGCVMAGGETPSIEVADLLKDSVSKFKKAGISMPELVKNWRPDELANDTNQVLLKSLKSLLK